MLHTTRRTFTMALPLALALLTMLCLPSCGGASGPEGTWVIDKEATKTAFLAKMKAQAPAGAQGEQAAAMAEQMIGPMIDQMKFHLTLKAGGAAEGSFTMMGDTKAATGTWTATGNTVTIKMDDGTGPETVTGTLSGSRMMLKMDGESPPITLQRA